jgi:hypothetical protein
VAHWNRDCSFHIFQFLFCDRYRPHQGQEDFMREANAEGSPTHNSGRAPSARGQPNWAQLLADAVSQPGIISMAYSRFWNYSVGNQILAMAQCIVRGIEPGPIHTFRGWIDLGRHVKKGEKAITLCMPVRVKRKLRETTAELPSRTVGEGADCQTPGSVRSPSGASDPSLVTVFTYKSHWFVLSQTEGADYVPTEMPQWSEVRALQSLTIDRVKFDHPNGNCQGYALARAVAVSPIAALPHKTLFHELAHVVLGHTAEGNTLDDHDLTPRNLREVEAECVALICCESLGLSGIPECRGYVQTWLGNQAIPDRSAQRIFKAADVILKSGYPANNPPEP